MLTDAGYMTTAEVAVTLGVSGARVRQHLAVGDIEPVGMAGSGTVYTREAVEGLLRLRAARGNRTPLVEEHL